MIPRTYKLLNSHSFSLFGVSGTGKGTLFQQCQIRDSQSLQALGADMKNSELYIISNQTVDSKLENVHVLHWKSALEYFFG
jgi:hypothetical protein